MADHVGECEDKGTYWLWWCACKGDNRTEQATLSKKNREFQTTLEPVHERILVEALEKLGYIVAKKDSDVGELIDAAVDYAMNKPDPGWLDGIKDAAQKVGWRIGHEREAAAKGEKP